MKKYLIWSGIFLCVIFLLICAPIGYASRKTLGITGEEFYLKVKELVEKRNECCMEEERIRILNLHDNYFLAINKALNQPGGGLKVVLSMQTDEDSGELRSVSIHYYTLSFFYYSGMEGKKEVIPGIMLRKEDGLKAYDALSDIMLEIFLGNIEGRASKVVKDMVVRDYRKYDTIRKYDRGEAVYTHMGSFGNLEEGHPELRESFVRDEESVKVTSILYPYRALCDEWGIMVETTIEAK